MNQRKRNKSLWYSLVLAALLCIAFLLSITGNALARYFYQERLPVTFQIAVPAQIYLGVMETREVPEQIGEITLAGETTETAAAEETTPTGATEPLTEEVFVPNVKPEWTKSEADIYRLRLAVANGTSDTDFSEKGQQVRLRLFGTLGLWAEGETVKITVYSGTEPDMQELEGKVSYIDEDSPLYETYGAGWVYTFHAPEAEDEYVWTLPGGSFQCIDLTITMDGGTISNSSLLQPQIIAELIAE